MKMASLQCQLDSLPVEIIRRIAASGRSIDALNLMRTNRRLLDICKDWTIFRQLIEDNNNMLIKRAHWSPGVLAPLDAWARYALAEMKLGEFLSTDEPVALLGWTITSFAPQLAISHHPSLDIQATKKLSQLLSEDHQDSHSVSLAFVIAASALSAFGEDDLVDSARTECYKIWSGYHTGISSTKMPSPDLCLWYLWPIPARRAPGDVFGMNFVKDPDASIYSVLVRAYKAIPFLYYELNIAIANNNFFVPHGAEEEELPAALPAPPTSANIPFSSLMPEVPLPFSPHSSETTITSHIPHMATAAFLSSGVWTGYLYTNTPRPSRSPRFQYPMFEVRFETSISEEIPTEVNFTTTGKMFTAKGPFDWSGNIDTTTGKMDMNARYQDDAWMVPLHWQAVMTPFGIVGSMGGDRHAHWMWMWKEEWC